MTEVRPGRRFGVGVVLGLLLLLVLGIAWIARGEFGGAGATLATGSGGTGRGAEEVDGGVLGPGSGQHAAGGRAEPSEDRAASETDLSVALSGAVFDLRGAPVRNGLVWIEARGQDGSVIETVPVHEGRFSFGSLPATEIVLHGDRNLFEVLHEPLDLRGSPASLEKDLVVAVPWGLDVHVEVPDAAAEGEPDPHWDANMAFGLMGFSGCAPVALAQAAGRTVGSLELRERGWREFLDGELSKAGTLWISARPPLEVSVRWAEGVYAKEYIEGYSDRVSFVIEAGDLLRFGGLRARFLRAGEPLVDQPVQLVSEHGALGVKTDREGRVWFSMVTPGEHGLRLGRSDVLDARSGDRFPRVWPAPTAPFGRFGRVDPGAPKPAAEGEISPRFGPLSITIEEGAELDLGDLEVEPGRSIEGRFGIAGSDATLGDSPGDATCWLELWNAQDPAELRLENVFALGFTGEFRIEGLEATHYFLRVRSTRDLARRRDPGPGVSSPGIAADRYPEFTCRSEICDLTHGSLAGVQLDLVPSVALVLRNPLGAEGPAAVVVREAGTGLSVGRERVLRAASRPMRLAPGPYDLEWTLVDGTVRRARVVLEGEVTQVSPPE